MKAADDLLYILQEAFVQKGPVVIDCPVDYRENLTLIEQHRKLASCQTTEKSLRNRPVLWRDSITLQSVTQS